MRTWLAAVTLSGMAVVAVADDPSAAASLARATLARTLQVAPDAIKVVDSAPAEWPDAGLGCPEKGMMYAQVITSGHRVQLEAAGKRYEVHVAGGHAVVCGGGSVAAGPARPPATAAPAPAPGAPPAGDGGSVGAAARVSRLARRELASSLKVPTSRVKVTSVRPTTWPDQRLGCAGSPAPAEAKPVRGFVVTLTAQGKTYRYHADEERVLRCE